MNDSRFLYIISNSPSQTQKIGMEIGKMVQKRDTLLLLGELGVGKTCLTQGIARGMTIKEYTSSPSFMVVKEYKGRLPLYHIDLYRLERIEEILDLGLDDYLYGQGVCVIEWADRGLIALPKENLIIRMNYISDIKRSLQFEPNGQRYVKLLSEAHSQLSHTEG